MSQMGELSQFGRAAGKELCLDKTWTECVDTHTVARCSGGGLFKHQNKKEPNPYVPNATMSCACFTLRILPHRHSSSEANQSVLGGRINRTRWQRTDTCRIKG